MYINFNKDLKKAIRKATVKVAKKLNVQPEELDFVVCTDENAGEKGMVDICFGSDYDDVFASLTLKEGSERLEDLVRGFAKNKNVEWRRLEEQNDSE